MADTEDTATLVHSFTLVSLLAASALYGNVLLRVPKALPGNDETYRARCHTYVSTSIMGSFLEAIMAIFSIGSCVTFVWETYLTGETPTWMFCAEMLFSVFFTFQYLLGLFVAPSRWRFVLSLHPLVDAVTVIPVLILYFSGTFTLTGGSVSFLRFSRVMKFARVLRLLRILRSVNVVSSAVTHDAVQNQFITFVSILLSLLVITTGFVQFISNDVENEPGQWGENVTNMQFHDALYFSIVTFALVGYGDIHPTATLGRISMTILITVAFIAIPMQMGVLVRKFRMKPGYSGVMKVATKESHIIVSSDVSCTGIPDFLAEFFHEDHGFQDAKICLLVPGEPNMYMQALILRYRRVTYLRGDAMSSEDLVRARCDSADAAFLLADRFALDADEQDSVTVLRAITMKSHMSPRNIYVQILLPENRRHLRMSGVPDANVLCVAQTKSSLVGLSLQMPGVAPLIQNLVSSISAKASSGVRKGELKPWQMEYFSGLTQEIYSVPLPYAFKGRPFSAVSLDMYQRYSLLLFGLERLESGRLHVVLNPGRSECIKRGDVGFFIAEDQLQMEQMVSDASQANGDDGSNFGRRTVPRWAKAFARQASQRFMGSNSSLYKGSDGSQLNLDAVSRRRNSAGDNAVQPLVSPAPGSSTAPASTLDPSGPPGSRSAFHNKRTVAFSLGEDEESKCLPTLQEGTRGVGPSPPTVNTGPSGRGLETPMSRTSAGTPTSRTLKSCDSLATNYNGSMLARHPSHPFMFFNTYALKRHGDPTAPKKDVPKRNTGSVWSAYVAARDQPANRYDAATAFEAAMRGDEVVGIRVGNANGITWEQCAHTLFRDVELNDTSRRGRRVNLLCALQIFYDSSGYSNSGDSQVLMSEVQQVLNHLPSITVPKQLITMPRKQRKSRARLGSTVYLKDTSLMERYALRVLDGTRGLVHGHIIVCCHSGTGLAFVIEALRNYDRARTKLCSAHTPKEKRVYPVRPVVGLIGDELSMYEREILAGYNDLFIVKGSPTSLPDLVRAGLETAAVMACHANPAHGTKFSGAGDAQVVMTTLIVESIYPGLRVVSELNRPKFVKHLGITGESHRSLLPEWLYMFEMVYAAGDVVNSSFLEALLCQAFFNSSIISVVEALLDHTEVGGETEGFEDVISPVGKHYRVSGRERRSRLMLGKRMLDSTTPTPANRGAKYRASKSHSTARTPAADQSRTGLSRGHLFQVDLPEGFAGRTYMELFAFLVHEFDIVPMGLLRCHETLAAGLSYVLTNPAQQTKLNKGDRVFVVGVPQLRGGGLNPSVGIPHSPTTSDGTPGAYRVSVDGSSHASSPPPLRSAVG